MAFDKSRVYTALNADELKIGSKILVAYDLATLKSLVEHVSDVSTLEHTLIGVHSETYAERFKTNYGCAYALAYLLSESKLKWTDLKVKDVIKRGRERAEVTYIDEEGFAENKNCHICIGCHGIMTDEELGEWEKVEE